MTDRRTAYRPDMKPVSASASTERDVPTGPVPTPHHVELAMARRRVAQRLRIAGPWALPGHEAVVMETPSAKKPGNTAENSRSPLTETPATGSPASPAEPPATVASPSPATPGTPARAPRTATDSARPAAGVSRCAAAPAESGARQALEALESRVGAVSSPTARADRPARTGPAVEIPSPGTPSSDTPSSDTPAPGRPAPDAPASVPRSTPPSPDRPAPPPVAARDSGPNVTVADSFADEKPAADESAEWRAPRKVGWRVSGSLSLLAPGAGQWLAGRPTLGLFYATTIALMVTLGWAILDTLERSVAVLELFGRSRTAAFWWLAGVYVVGSLLYLSNVLTATESAEEHPAYPASPILSGAASLVIPGWGQVINGHRIRATIFLALVLSLAAVGATVQPSARALLERFDLYLPYWDALHRAPTLRWTVPLLIWALAIYDAAASATAQRKARAF